MRNYTTSEGGGVRRLNTDDPVQRSYDTGREQSPWSCTNVRQASMAGLIVWRKCWLCLKWQMQKLNVTKSVRLLFGKKGNT